MKSATELRRKSSGSIDGEKNQEKVEIVFALHVN